MNYAQHESILRILITNSKALFPFRKRHQDRNGDRPHKVFTRLGRLHDAARRLNCSRVRIDQKRQTLCKEKIKKIKTRDWG